MSKVGLRTLPCVDATRTNWEGTAPRPMVTDLWYPDASALVTLFKSLVENDTNHKQSYRDERVRCVFAIAPVLAEAFTPAGLAPIETPVKIVVGEADTFAPARTNAMRFASLIQRAELTLLEGQVAHYTFLGEGTEIGK